MFVKQQAVELLPPPRSPVRVCQEIVSMRTRDATDVKTRGSNDETQTATQLISCHVCWDELFTLDVCPRSVCRVEEDRARSEFWRETNKPGALITITGKR